MLLWHLGIATLIVYVTLGRRRIDYRMILIGAVLPDFVDGGLGLFFFEGPEGRWIAHSVFTAIAVTVLIILAFSGDQRQSLFGIGVGWLLHLVLVDPERALRLGSLSRPSRASDDVGRRADRRCHLGLVLGGLPARRIRSVQTFSVGWLPQAVTRDV